MGYEFQVTVDAADPHTQAKWWAQTLGWRVEPSDEDFIRRMVAAGHATEEETQVFEGTLVWKLGAAISDPEHQERPRVLFQLVPEAKSVKNRLHLDVRVGEDKQAVADALVARGATILHRGQVGPQWWITMADPEGNEFCVS
ncbi:VOC family protein [Rhodococcus oryzae]|uniref:VOC family protein n=1 Tax=Rhodococcus oryzae TaxID=2571143 RepID=A0ABY2RGS4_9NOCA|nr:VOC family protein [Rhodococcus oryzae]TJZ73703.1 VOC family protein [Rhodococcus oryzae]